VPEAFVVVFAATPVRTLVIVTVASGTAALLGSSTAPESEASMDCA
jgi:hypothetical protein